MQHRSIAVLLASVLIVVAASMTGCDRQPTPSFGEGGGDGNGNVPGLLESTNADNAPLAPDFTLPDINADASITLSDLRGKWVLLDFWATWCKPCHVMADQRLKPLHERYGARDDFILISVGIPSNDTIADQRRLATQRGWSWLKVFDTQGAAAAAYNVTAIPHLSLINPDGRLLWSGGNNIDSIERVLAEAFQ